MLEPIHSLHQIKEDEDHDGKGNYNTNVEQHNEGNHCISSISDDGGCGFGSVPNNCSGSNKQKFMAKMMLNHMNSNDNIIMNRSTSQGNKQSQTSTSPQSLALFLNKKKQHISPSVLSSSISRPYNDTYYDSHNNASMTSATQSSTVFDNEDDINTNDELYIFSDKNSTGTATTTGSSSCSSSSVENDCTKNYKDVNRNKLSRIVVNNNKSSSSNKIGIAGDIVAFKNDTNDNHPQKYTSSSNVDDTMVQRKVEEINNNSETILVVKEENDKTIATSLTTSPIQSRSSFVVGNNNNDNNDNETNNTPIRNNTTKVRNQLLGSSVRHLHFGKSTNFRQQLHMSSKALVWDETMLIDNDDDNNDDNNDETNYEDECDGDGDGDGDGDDSIDDDENNQKNYSNSISLYSKLQLYGKISPSSSNKNKYSSGNKSNSNINRVDDDEEDVSIHLIEDSSSSSFECILENDTNQNRVIEQVNPLQYSWYVPENSNNNKKNSNNNNKNLQNVDEEDSDEEDSSDNNSNSNTDDEEVEDKYRYSIRNLCVDLNNDVVVADDIDIHDYVEVHERNQRILNRMKENRIRKQQQLQQQQQQNQQQQQPQTLYEEDSDEEQEEAAPLKQDKVHAPKQPSSTATAATPEKTPTKHQQQEQKLDDEKIILKKSAIHGMIHTDDYEIINGNTTTTTSNKAQHEETTIVAPVDSYYDLYNDYYDEERQSDIIAISTIPDQERHDESKDKNTNSDKDNAVDVNASLNELTSATTSMPKKEVKFSWFDDPRNTTASESSNKDLNVYAMEIPLSSTASAAAAAAAAYIASMTTMSIPKSTTRSVLSSSTEDEKKENVSTSEEDKKKVKRRLNTIRTKIENRLTMDCDNCCSGSMLYWGTILLVLALLMSLVLIVLFVAPGIVHQNNNNDDAAATLWGSSSSSSSSSSSGGNGDGDGVGSNNNSNNDGETSNTASPSINSNENGLYVNAGDFGITFDSVGSVIGSNSDDNDGDTSIPRWFVDTEFLVGSDSGWVYSGCPANITNWIYNDYDNDPEQQVACTERFWSSKIGQYEIPTSIFMTSSTTIPTTSTYRYDLHFIELFFEEEGNRVFNVSVEDTVIASNLDIYKKAGGKLIVYTLSGNVMVTDSSISIEFVGIVGDPKINAFEIHPIF